MKTKNTYISLVLLMFITVTISGYEFFTAVKNFDPTGNIFDFCNGAVEYIPYFMIFILVLFTALPIALVLFKENNISLKNAIIKKEYLAGDIIYGIILGVVSVIIAYLFSLISQSGCNYEHIKIYDKSSTFYILYFLSLSLVCGCLKELYFRGLAKYFISKTFGETQAYILTAILFGIVDWQNIGSSVVLGILWGLAYKKRDRLIVPIIAHGLLNTIGLVFQFMFL